MEFRSLKRIFSLFKVFGEILIINQVFGSDSRKEKKNKKYHFFFFKIWFDFFEKKKRNEEKNVSSLNPFLDWLFRILERTERMGRCRRFLLGARDPRPPSSDSDPDKLMTMTWERVTRSLRPDVRPLKMSWEISLFKNIWREEKLHFFTCKTCKIWTDDWEMPDRLNAHRYRPRHRPFYESSSDFEV